MEGKQSLYARESDVEVCRIVETWDARTASWAAQRDRDSCRYRGLCIEHGHMNSGSDDHTSICLLPFLKHEYWILTMYVYVYEQRISQCTLCHSRPTLIKHSLRQQVVPYARQNYQDGSEWFPAAQVGQQGKMSQGRHANASSNQHRMGSTT